MRIVSSCWASGLLAVALFLGAVPSAHANPLHALYQRLYGFDTERMERLSDFMVQAVADGTMVGGVGLIARDGRVVMRKAWGLQERKAQTPMQTDTIFRIYSMTKPVTSVAVMMLYEEGKFFLHDPIAKYIPELADLRVATATGSRPAKRQPTIRDLLTHTAGFSYGFFGRSAVDQAYLRGGWLTDPNGNLGDFVRELGRLPLLFDPGERWHYSLSVDVLGRLVEVTSGMRFDTFLQTRLFAPLGMEDTGFRVPKNKQARFAQLYSPAALTDADLETAFDIVPDSNALVEADADVSASYQADATATYGGQGLVSTVDDYLKFAQMMLNEGEYEGTRYLSPKTVALIRADHLGVRPGTDTFENVGFGLGFGVVRDLGEYGELGSVGTYYWGGAAGTTFWIDPEEALIGIFMTQSIPHHTKLREQFRLLTYQAIEESDDKAD